MDNGDYDSEETDSEDHDTEVHIPTRGPLGAEAKQYVQRLRKADGWTVAQIAAYIHRSHEVVEKALGIVGKKAQKAARGAGKQKAAAAPKAVARQPKAARKQPAVKTVETLKHKFWIRPDTAVEFVLPTDLTSEEAQRLARVIENVAFESAH